MNLVIGATGMLGSEICRLLRKENKAVRAMVRKTADPIKINRLKELHIEVVYGDLRQPATFKPALKDVNAIITSASSMPFSYAAGTNHPELVDRKGMIKLIDEAKKAGIKRFVYTSFTGNINIDFPLSSAKRAVEAHLKKSGIVYTILRPGYFMEAWLTAMVGFDVAEGKIQICGDGIKPVSYISYKDVARYATECMNNPAARNATLELGGPQKLSQLEAVRIFEETMGKKFTIQHTPLAAIKSQFETATDPMQKSFAGLMLCLAKGDPIDMNELTEKYNLRLSTIREYAKGLAVKV